MHMTTVSITHYQANRKGGFGTQWANSLGARVRQLNRA